MRDERQKHGSQTVSDTDKLRGVINREPPQIKQIASVSKDGKESEK